MKFPEGVGIYFHSNGRGWSLRVGGERGLYAKNAYTAAGRKQFVPGNIISERVSRDDYYRTTVYGAHWPRVTAYVLQ